MHTINEPSISSQRLGINAYEKAQMNHPVRKSANRAVDALKGSLGRTPSKRATKEMKMSVLKSLQGQSNSGLVKIRDVAAAIDYFLKKS